MRLDVHVALGFLREGRAQTLFIIAGASVGVGVVVFISALISGLQADIIARTLGAQAHIHVRPPDEVARQQLEAGPNEVLLRRVEPAAQRQRTIDGWQRVLEQLSATSQVVAAAARVDGAGLALSGQVSRPVMLLGVEPEAYGRIIDFGAQLVGGAFLLGGGDVVIGVELAEELGLGVDDKLRLETGEDRGDVFMVRGIFDLGVSDANERIVLVALKRAQSLLGLGGAVTAIDLRVRDIFAAEGVATRLRADTGLVAESWMTTQAQLLTALRAQSASSLIIRVFVIIAVAMGIASVLAVTVVQRQRQVGILRAMGMRRSDVTRIFLFQGAAFGLVGSLLGSVIGAALAAIFSAFARRGATGLSFPIEVEPDLVVAIVAIATMTGVVAAGLPARRAARLDAAVAIRHD